MKISLEGLKNKSAKYTEFMGTSFASTLRELNPRAILTFFTASKLLRKFSIPLLTFQCVSNLPGSNWKVDCFVSTQWTSPEIVSPQVTAHFLDNRQRRTVCFSWLGLNHTGHFICPGQRLCYFLLWNTKGVSKEAVHGRWSITAKWLGEKLSRRLRVGEAFRVVRGTSRPVLDAR